MDISLIAVKELLISTNRNFFSILRKLSEALSRDIGSEYSVHIFTDFDTRTDSKNSYHVMSFTPKFIEQAVVVKPCIYHEGTGKRMELPSLTVVQGEVVIALGNKPMQTVNANSAIKEAFEKVVLNAHSVAPDEPVLEFHCSLNREEYEAKYLSILTTSGFFHYLEQLSVPGEDVVDFIDLAAQVAAEPHNGSLQSFGERAGYLMLQA